MFDENVDSKQWKTIETLIWNQRQRSTLINDSVKGQIA